MNIPSFIHNQIPKNPFCNNYYSHADENWTRLSMIADGSIPYISSDLALLVNTLELEYKGFLKCMVQNRSDYELPLIDGNEDNPEYYLQKDHYLKGLVREIERHFVNMSPVRTKRDRIEHDRFLVSLQWEYTNSRYTSYPSFDEFLSIYKFAQTQKTALRDYIQEQLIAKTDELGFEVNI